MTPRSELGHPAHTAPGGFEVLDLTGPPESRPEVTSRFTIGRYDERRPGMYTTDLFEEGRCVHMGIDLGGPAGTPVHAFASGEVIHAGYNPAPGDYGHVLVLEHALEGRVLYALYGHLSAATLGLSSVGRKVQAGDVLGWLGGLHENGGWPPHLHFQLAKQRPETHDLPGVVTQEERAAALEAYPDPREVLGPLYEDD